MEITKPFQNLQTHVRFLIAWYMPYDKFVNATINSTCKNKDTIAAQFPHLVSKNGLSKTHVTKSKIDQKFTAKHQKVDEFPLIYNPWSRRNYIVYKMKFTLKISIRF